jgi:hypothetical protein
MSSLAKLLKGEGMPAPAGVMLERSGLAATRAIP